MAIGIRVGSLGGRDLNVPPGGSRDARGPLALALEAPGALSNQPLSSPPNGTVGAHWGLQARSATRNSVGDSLPRGKL